MDDEDYDPHVQQAAEILAVQQEIQTDIFFNNFPAHQAPPPIQPATPQLAPIQ